MMAITGLYNADKNFIRVYAQDVLYTIARATSNWSAVRVGERTATGHILTKDMFDQWAGECTCEGSFTIAE